MFLIKIRKTYAVLKQQREGENQGGSSFCARNITILNESLIFLTREIVIGFMLNSIFSKKKKVYYDLTCKSCTLLMIWQLPQLHVYVDRGLVIISHNAYALYVLQRVGKIWIKVIFPNNWHVRNNWTMVK